MEEDSLPVCQETVRKFLLPGPQWTCTLPCSIGMVAKTPNPVQPGLGDPAEKKKVNEIKSGGALEPSPLSIT